MSMKRRRWRSRHTNDDPVKALRMLHAEFHREDRVTEEIVRVVRVAVVRALQQQFGQSLELEVTE